MRRAARKDANHNQIQAAFEKAGCSVKDVSQLKGFVDLVAGRNGVNYLIEIKDGDKPPSERKLKDEFGYVPS